MGNTNKGKRNQKQHSRYKVIVKVNSDKFCTWKCHDLLKLVVFLNRDFPNWRWFNVYSYIGSNKGIQLASYTTKKLPRYPYVS